MKTFFKVISINIRGIKKKLSDLICLIAKYNPSIICIQETLLGSDDEIMLPNYNVLSVVRKKNGGGLCIAIKKDIKYNIITFNNKHMQNMVEIMGIRVYNEDKSDTKIYNIYIPPTTLMDEMNILYSIDVRNSIICGDFNSHQKSWSVGQPNSKGSFLEKWIKNNDLLICNKEKIAKFVRINKRETTPDLMMMNNNIKKWLLSTNIEEWSASDHMPIISIFNYPKNKNPIKIYKTAYDLKTFKEIKYTNEIKFQLEKIKRNYNHWKTIKFDWNNINNIIISSFNKSCKIKKIPLSRKGNCWFNEEIDKAIKKRNKYWNKLKKNASTINYEKFKKQKRIVKKLISNTKKEFWKKLNSKLDIINVFKKLRNKKYTDKNNIQITDKKVVINDEEFVNSFISQIKKNEEKSLRTTQKYEFKKINIENIKLLNKEIDSTEIEEIIGKLDIHKSPGLDRTNNFMIKKAGKNGVEFLKFIYNKIWNNEFYPDIWNKAIIVPVPKKKCKKLEKKTNSDPYLYCHQSQKFLKKLS